MKKILLFILAAASMVACKKTTVDFTYSPTAPRAGQAISFTNASSSGEEWEWTFGDGATSTSKSPTKTYRQPGRYTVTLKVDKKAQWTKSKEITVYDTIPSFVINTPEEDRYIFHDLSMEALVYNPYRLDVKYQWGITGPAYVNLNHSDTLLNLNKLALYFIAPGTATITLDVTMDGVVTHLSQTITIADRATTSVLMATSTNDTLRQRVFGQRYETIRTLDYVEGKALLQLEQDTIQLYNDSLFRVEELSIPGYTPIGFAIANRKMYFRTAEGLFVCTIDGRFIQPICELPVQAICTDAVDNRLYWAVADSVMYMPLIMTDNNHFPDDAIHTLNHQQGVCTIAIDPVLR